MGFVVVVDGHNFLNSLRDNGKDVNYVTDTLSFPVLHGIIQDKLDQNGLAGRPFLHTYFVCSDRGQIGDLRGEDRNRFISKLKNERGVTVDEIRQTHAKRKQEQVDMHVFIRMLELGPLARPLYDSWRHIVLISADTDFVPAIRLLSAMGVHTIVIGFDSKEHPYPKELKNESYLFLELGEMLKEMEKNKDLGARPV